MQFKLVFIVLQLSLMISKPEPRPPCRKHSRERSKSRLKHGKCRRSDEPCGQDAPTSGGNSAAFDELVKQIRAVI